MAGCSRAVQVDALANITDGCFIRPSVSKSRQFFIPVKNSTCCSVSVYRKEVSLYFNTSLWLVCCPEDVFVVVKNRCLTRTTDS
jgi:hypothetical protein